MATALTQETTFIFNPWHDIAMSYNSEHCLVPASTLEFASNCKGITTYMRGLFADSSLPFQPWGWDLVLRKELLNSGCQEAMLPTKEYLQTIRELSHRKVAIEAHKSLLAQANTLPITESAKETFSIAEVKDILNKRHDIIMKMPWSGSGRGIRQCFGTMPPKMEDWCKNVINKQGSLIVEPLYRVVQNFAMLFYCSASKVDFAGYSMFNAINCNYTGNYLCSNKYIEQTMAKYIGLENLLCVRECLLSFIKDKFLHKYVGYVGIDQLIYRDMDTQHFVLHPVVEINVRMTMGILARNLYDNFGHLEPFGTPINASENEIELKVIYGKSPKELSGQIENTFVLAETPPTGRYAIVLKKIDKIRNYLV